MTDHIATLEEVAKECWAHARVSEQAHMSGVAEDFRDVEAKITAAIALMRGRKNETPKECAWSWEDDYFAPMWKGSCGIAWQFTAGGPAGNECNFCPRCGGRIAISKDTADEQ